MSLLKIQHNKKLNYYTKSSSTPVAISIFNASNNEYDLINDPSQKLYVLPLDEYYADIKKEVIDGKLVFTIYFKQIGTARFKVIYDYKDQLGRQQKETQIIQFVCYEKFFSTNYKYLVADFDYNIIQKNEKFKVIIENIFEMFDILYAYSNDSRDINNPLLTKSKFLETLGRDIGFERIDTEDLDTQFEQISNNLYRSLLSVMSRILNLRGTPLSYQLFFNTLGYDIVINEYWWDNADRLVEINTSNPIFDSTFDLYTTEGIFLNQKSSYDPRTLVDPNEPTKNAKSNFISVQLSALKDNLGIPVDYAPDVQTLSANKKRVIKEYLAFLRPQHIQYLNEIIHFNLSEDGKDYELIDFLDLITETLSVQQLISINNTMPPMIKAYRYFDLIDFEDELWMVDWDQYYLINNENSFDVFFDQPLDPVSAQTIANYNIKRDGTNINASVQSITLINSKTVRITFSSAIVLGLYDITHTGIYSIYGKTYVTPSNIIENPYHLKFRLTEPVLFPYTQFAGGPILPFQLIKVKALVNSQIEITFNNNMLPFFPVFDKLKNKVTLPTTTTLSNFKIYRTDNLTPLTLYFANIEPLAKNKILFDVSLMDQGQQYTFEILNPAYIHTNNDNNFFDGPLTMTFNGIGPGYNEDGILLPPEPPVPTWQELLQDNTELLVAALVESIEKGEDTIQEPVKWNQINLNWGDLDLYWGKAAFFDDFNTIKKKENPTDPFNPFDAINIDSLQTFNVNGFNFTPFTISMILKQNLLNDIIQPITKDRNLYYEVPTKKINILRTW